MKFNIIIVEEGTVTYARIEGIAKDAPPLCSAPTVAVRGDKEVAAAFETLALLVASTFALAARI